MKKLELCFDLEEINARGVIAVSELIDAIKIAGIGDSHLIDDIHVISFDGQNIRVVIDYRLCRGIGYMNANVDTIIIFVNLQVNELLYPSVGEKTDTGSGTTGTDVPNPLMVMQDKIDNAIRKGDIYKAQEWLNLMEAYKNTVIDR